MKAGVKIDYAYIDGAHFFTSPDPEVQGLCVASMDPATAYNEVAVQLNTLAKLNHNLDTNYLPPKPVEEFLASIQKWIDEQEKVKIPGFQSTATSNWLIQEAA